MRHLLAWGPALAWVVVLFLLSELRQVPEALRPLAALNDKLIHATLYAFLGAALAWARVRSPRPLPHILLLALGYLYGALDEWHQSFVPGRSPEFGDWVADVVGVTLGYLLTLFLFRALRVPDAASASASHRSVSE